MQKKEVSDYVMKNLERGVPIKDVRNALSKAGWSKKEIDDGINILNKEPSNPNFRDKDYGKYLSHEEKSNKKAFFVFALILLLCIAIGYFLYSQNISGAEKETDDMQTTNQNEQEEETLGQQETPSDDTIQTVQNQEDDAEVQDEPIINDSTEEDQPEPSGCIEQHYKMCYFGSVYWYDSCYNKGELAEECSGDCINGSCIVCQAKVYKECYSGDVYWFDSCRIRGERAEECDYECSNSTCLNQTES